MNLSENAKKALEFIRQHPGTTSTHVGNFLGVRSHEYGTQRAGSWAIKQLREAGLIEDCERCPHCRRATTRGEKNRPLYVREAK